MNAARRRAVVAAARDCGCSVGPEETAASGAGTESVLCKDGWGAARFLTALSRRAWQDDTADPCVAQAIAAIRGDHLQGIGELSARELIERVMQWTQHHIRFEPETGEIFQGPAALIRSGVGDCDCHARLVATLLRGVGVPARFLFLAAPGAGPRHVLCEAWDGARWLPLETTVRGARAGEDPVAAAVRLGMVRPDVVGNFSERITMGQTGIEGGKRYTVTVRIRSNGTEEYGPAELAANFLSRQGFSVQSAEHQGGGVVVADVTYQRAESRELGALHETDETPWEVTSVVPVVPEVFGDPPRDAGGPASTPADPTETAAPMPKTGRFFPATKTTVSKAAFNAALHEAWPGVTRPAAAVLWAQYAIETGRGSACWNNNIGNVKKTSNDGHDFTMLHNVWEIINGKRQTFQPPHPQTWFRSYPTLGQGMRAQLDILKKRWPKAWRFVELGDADAFARALKAGGYYTAPVEQYAAALRSLSAEYLKDAATAVPFVGVGLGLAAVLAVLYGVYSTS